MKKQLLVACGLAVLATPAFASKARLEALGEDNFGSYYINDNRNQFLNPAKINDQKDLVTYEFGASSASNGTLTNNGTGGAATTIDSAAAPKAEAGFNKAWNNMVYGLHFGNSTPTAGVVRSLAGTTLQERNPWDLFVGGDAGVKWGANLTWENSNQGSARTATTDTRVSSNALRGRVGVVAGDLEVLAHYSFMGDAKDYVGNMVDGSGSWLLGAGYMINSYKIFADYKHVDTEYSDTATATVKKDWSLDELRLGVGRQERLNDKATLFGKVSLERQAIEDEGTSFFTAGVKAENTRWILPLNVGLEYDAASWLVLRTSVSQYVWSKNEFDPNVSGTAGRKLTRNLANTAVRAGATLKFGEFSVDGLISTNDSGDGLAAGNTLDTSGGNGSLRTDQLMSRVSMTYRF